MEEEKNITNLNQPYHDHNEIKRLLEKNIELSEQVLRFSKKINNFVIQQRIFFVLKVLLIAVPVVLGIIYLPTYLNEILHTIADLKGVVESLRNFSGGSLLDKIK